VKNIGGFADHLLSTSLPWRLGHSNTNALIGHAYREGLKFELTQSGDMWRAHIGGQAVGLLRHDGLDLVTWPVVDRAFDDFSLHEALRVSGSSCRRA
jgi:hypothetical protein